MKTRQNNFLKKVLFLAHDYVFIGIFFRLFHTLQLLIHDRFGVSSGLTWKRRRIQKTLMERCHDGFFFLMSAGFRSQKRVPAGPLDAKPGFLSRHRSYDSVRAAGAKLRVCLCVCVCGRIMCVFSVSLPCHL